MRPTLSQRAHDLIWRDRSWSVCSRAWVLRRRYRTWAIVVAVLGERHCRESYRWHRSRRKGEKMERINSTSDERTTNNAVRHKYRVLSDAEKAQMQEIKDMGAAFIAKLHEIGGSVPRQHPRRRRRDARRSAHYGLSP